MLIETHAAGGEPADRMKGGKKTAGGKAASCTWIGVDY